MAISDSVEQLIDDVRSAQDAASPCNTDPPRLVLVIEPTGVRALHLSASTWAREKASLALYARLATWIDALDTAARLNAHT